MNNQLTKKLRELWVSKPSPTLFETACRICITQSQAEQLVNHLTASGIVEYKVVDGEFKAVFV